MDEHAPLKKKRAFIDRPLQPWINEDILSAKRQRRKVEVKYKIFRLLVHKIVYRELWLSVKDLVANAKAEFHIQKIKD